MERKRVRVYPHVGAAAHVHNASTHGNPNTVGNKRRDVEVVASILRSKSATSARTHREEPGESLRTITIIAKEFVLAPAIVMTAIYALVIALFTINMRWEKMTRKIPKKTN